MVVEAKPAKDWDIVSGTTTYALVLIPIALISLMAEPSPPPLNDHSRSTGHVTDHRLHGESFADGRLCYGSRCCRDRVQVQYRSKSTP